MKLIRTNNEEKMEVLRGNPYFSDLNPKIVAEVITDMRLHHYEKNETVFWEGDESSGLHMIRKGSVKLFKISPQGRELVIKVMEKGATFNEVPVFDHEPNPVNVIAIEDSEIWVIDAELLRRCIAEYPELELDDEEVSLDDLDLEIDDEEELEVEDDDEEDLVAPV